MTTVVRSRTFGVFVHVRHDRAPLFTAYTRYYDAQWEGFFGQFEGMGATHAAAKTDALRAAREKWRAMMGGER